MKFKLPEGWKKVEISQLGEVVTGKTPRTKVSEYFNGYTPFLTPSDDMEKRFVSNTNRTLSKKGVESVRNQLIPKGSVSVSCIGSQLGKVVITRENTVTNQQINSIVVNENINNMFVYYAMLLIGEKLRYISKTSTAVPIINKTNFSKEEILLPEFSEQKSIANTLSALDDKIENNNRVNENLEQQAQEIFKHWFVDFEFPNENGMPYKSSGGEMVESELGMIPSNFKVDSLGKSELGKLMTPGVDSYEGEKIYLATADVSGRDIVNHETLVTMENKPSRANMQPKPNTVWFAKMKDSRKLIMVDSKDNMLQEGYVFSTGFAGIQATELSIYYLWTYLQSEDFDEIKNLYTTGTTMQAINNKNIKRIQIVIPSENHLSKFNYIVQPMYKKIIKNRNENLILSKLRDTLLPKLMSGELRIPLDE